MSTNPLVSIIIPTYNREKKLPDAIHSAINQTYKNVQIIVVDDGSTDQTKELIAKYPEIEYYWKENGGQASARNFGLRKAEGTILASLDSDDIWHADFLECCIRKLESEQLDFVFANWDQDTKNGESWSFLNNDPFLKPYFGKERDHWINLNNLDLRDLYIQACPSPSSSLVMRKSSVVSGWDENMNIGDDWCLYLEMILTKECKAAFTLSKLWRKRVDEINVYDGRKWSEVLELLYVADLKAKMAKFSTLLTQNERKQMEERYMASLIELSKHNLIRELNLLNSVRLLKKSFNINIPYTLKTIPQIFLIGFQRKINSLANKFKKTNLHS